MANNGVAGGYAAGSQMPPWAIMQTCAASDSQRGTVAAMMESAQRSCFTT